MDSVIERHRSNLQDLESMIKAGSRIMLMNHERRNYAKIQSTQNPLLAESGRIEQWRQMVCDHAISLLCKEFKSKSGKGVDWLKDRIVDDEMNDKGE